MIKTQPNELPVNQGKEGMKQFQVILTKILLLLQPLWRTVWGFLKKLEIKLPYDPAIPLLGTYPEETKIEKDPCIPLYICTAASLAFPVLLGI